MPEMEDDSTSPEITDDDGNRLYEHFRFEADKGQELLRVDKFLVLRMQKA
ncbi:MAG: RNA pseudouridine synthase, partial [Muribaculaceae bacterium]|nr:RNA pseudouridine synthase [Muribaculaceae bacterium]